MGSKVEHRSNYTSHTREVDSQWPLLFPFPVVHPRSPGCRGRMDEGVRTTIPHKGIHEMVLLILQVLSLLYNGPGTVIKTPYRAPLYLCWMVRPKVQVHLSVCICLRYTVMSSYHLHSLLSWYQGRGRPISMVNFMVGHMVFR